MLLKNIKFNLVFIQRMLWNYCLFNHEFMFSIAGFWSSNTTILLLKMMLYSCSFPFPLSFFQLLRLLTASLANSLLVIIFQIQCCQLVVLNCNTTTANDTGGLHHSINFNVVITALWKVLRWSFVLWFIVIFISKIR